MATFYLLNTVTFATKNGPQKQVAGSLIDNAVVDTSRITAAGGVLWPSSDAFIAAVASLAQKAKKRGADDIELNTIMQQGINARAKQDSQTGEVALVAGVGTVAGLALNASSRVFASYKTPAGTLGAALKVTHNGTDTVTITSVTTAGATVATDTSTVSYAVIG